MSRVVRAYINAQVGRASHRYWHTTDLEAYVIASAMDTDSDAFSIDLGSPGPDLSFLLRRDTEVRVSLFTGIGAQADVKHLQQGIADEISYDTDDQIMSIAGRDFSSIAVDSQAPPGEWRHVRPHKRIKKEAEKLGFSRFQIADMSSIGKFYRDGSESYWEAWYRMVRKKKMYIWLEPDGILVVDKPHYSESATYFFGEPKAKPRHAHWFQVESCRVTKSNTGRVGEVWVFGERSDIGFVGKAKDRSIHNWKKQPLKIITSSKAKNQSQAVHEAWEEIFEGKVGALEIELTVASPNRILRQNRMAKVNLPTAGINGVFFVVGVTVEGGSDGFVQRIRLREKKFALTRRVPDDPELIRDDSNTKFGGDIASALNVRWADSFVTYARQYHNGWDYSLFLGVVLSICKHESGFRNVRGGGTIEWYPKPGGSGGVSVDPQTGAGHGVSGNAQSRIYHWKQLFANSRLNPLNPRYPNSETAVGPMQLVTPSFKVAADKYGGKHDEYEGGRWKPDSNIRAGIEAFKGKLAGLDPKVDANIWIGVARYYGGTATATAQYVADVKSIYKTHFKDVVESAIENAQNIGFGQTTNIRVRDDGGNPFTVEIPDIAPPTVKRAINFALRQLGKPYRWGAAGPSSFDCSGLVIAAYRDAGVRSSLIGPGHPSNTYSLYHGYKHVTKDNLLPGDMVFFTNLEHMGMYIGKGHMIQAPHTGDVVKISAINSGYYRAVYYGAARIVPWDGRGRDKGD